MATADRQVAVKSDGTLLNVGEQPVAVRASRCFLCGETSSRVVLREGAWEGRQCRCGLVYTYPQPLEGIIDSTEDLHPDDFYGFSARFKARWMSQRCPRGRLLEIGCGNGHFLHEARNLGYEAAGLEPDPHRARLAREQYQLAVHEAFLANHELPRGHFDVVYHCDMLSHFHDPVAALRSMTELLRPGGVLCFEVGILGGIDPRWYRAVGSVGLERHIWLYSASALDRLFTEARLQVVAKQRFGLMAQLLAAVGARIAMRSVRAVAGRGQATGRAGAATAKQYNNHSSLKSLQQRLANFLRYRVGTFMPPYGPQTLLYVVRPE